MLLDLIPEARREILKTLKRRGPLPVEAIADALEITVSGARQHLSGLERDGVVTHQRIREGPGRPRHLYELTDMGDALFPRRYRHLAEELLGYVQNIDAGMLDQVFSRRTHRRSREARERLHDLDSFEERVHALADLLEEEGYMPQVERIGEGAFRIVERNCLVRAFAERYAGACAAEMAFMRKALPEAEVQRITHAVNDKPCCAYEVRLARAEQPTAHGVDR